MLECVAGCLRRPVASGDRRSRTRQAQPFWRRGRPSLGELVAAGISVVDSRLVATRRRPISPPGRPIDPGGAARLRVRIITRGSARLEGGTTTNPLRNPGLSHFARSRPPHPSLLPRSFRTAVSGGATGGPGPLPTVGIHHHRTPAFTSHRSLGHDAGRHAHPPRAGVVCETLLDGTPSGPGLERIPGTPLPVPYRGSSAQRWWLAHGRMGSGEPGSDPVATSPIALVNLGGSPRRDDFYRWRTRGPSHRHSTPLTDCN